MTPTESRVLIWAVIALLSIIAWIGKIFVASFIKMAKDINEIKIAVQIGATKHEGLEKRVEHLEEKCL